ncbi:hypothetical protein B0G93_11837 [Bacillus sp. V-88]|nr:hypothetical protein B0G93_11837 [Bacillus sp. V-88]SLK23995.1 hypothetical protein SAMN06295884_11837 [Bacillus sp. V-88]
MSEGFLLFIGEIAEQAAALSQTKRQLKREYSL